MSNLYSQLIEGKISKKEYNDLKLYGKIQTSEHKVTSGPKKSNHFFL